METVPDSPDCVLVLGGARSGKSAFAEEIAAHRGEPVLYVATGVAGDLEMEARIQAHRASRPSTWTTVEASRGLGRAVREAGVRPRTVLVDSVTMLVSNVLLVSGPQGGPAAVGAASVAVDAELDDLLDVVQSIGAPLVLVSDEVGMGLVPESPLGRAFREVLGRANQRLAAVATGVYLVVAGIPLPLKQGSA